MIGRRADPCEHGRQAARSERDQPERPGELHDELSHVRAAAGGLEFTYRDYSANTRTVHNARLSEIERGDASWIGSEIVDLASALQIAPSELMSCRCQHWPTGTPKAL
jgi:hypothetical protein